MKSIVIRSGNSLTPQEKKRLKQLEAVIEKRIDAFVEVGEALIEICDKQLYREKYPTFKEYCKQEWDYSKSYAYRLISEAKVKRSLMPPSNKNRASDKSHKSPIGDTRENGNEAVLPEEYNITVENLNEAQARELTPIPAKQRADVLAFAIKLAQRDSKPLTAEYVKRSATLQLQINARKARDAQIEADIKAGRWTPDPNSIIGQAMREAARLQEAKRNPKPSTNSLKGQEERISESFFVIKTLGLWKDYETASFEQYMDRLVARLKSELCRSPMHRRENTRQPA
jgi:hypothetical protein